MPIIVCLGLFTNKMPPHKCSHLDTYLPTIHPSTSWYTAAHTRQPHSMLTRGPFIFSQNSGARRGNYIYQSKHLCLWGGRWEKRGTLQTLQSVILMQNSHLLYYILDCRAVIWTCEGHASPGFKVEGQNSEFPPIWTNLGKKIGTQMLSGQNFPNSGPLCWDINGSSPSGFLTYIQGFQWTMHWDITAWNCLGEFCCCFIVHCCIVICGQLDPTDRLPFFFLNLKMISNTVPFRPSVQLHITMTVNWTNEGFCHGHRPPWTLD